MNHHQKEMIIQHWNSLKPQLPSIGLDFYARLFEVAPGVRHLFKEDITEQSKKLTHVLGFVVAHIHQLDTITQQVIDLGKRHQNYGAQPAHYDVVGQCLIETLKVNSSEMWNDELQTAWISAFTIVKDAMISAQKEEVLNV
jgi:nitric oxide dioxygenase